MSRQEEHSIFTVTGQRFWPLDPHPAEINIVDIAHALANQCRFTGHTQEFYSVAQHSVLVSHEVPEEHALWGLLHDATEAYLIDLARPVKMQMPEFQKVENRLMEAVATRFSLPMPMPEEVHHADRVLLMTERRDFMPQAGAFHAKHSGGVQPLPNKLRAWNPGEAKHAFLERYRRLTQQPMPAQFQSCSLGDGLCGLERDLAEQSIITLADMVANGERKI